MNTPNKDDILRRHLKKKLLTSDDSDNVKILLAVLDRIVDGTTDDVFQGILSSALDLNMIKCMSCDLFKKQGNECHKCGTVLCRKCFDEFDNIGLTGCKRLPCAH